MGSVYSGVLITCITLTIIGCLTVIASYLRYAKLRTMSYRLVMFLSVADIGASAPYLLPSSDHNTCIAQAYLLTAFQLSTVLWTTAIANVLFETITKGNTDFQKRFIAYNIVCWGVPIIMASLPFSTNSYGYSHGWCWIKEFDDNAARAHYDIGVWWRMLTFYLPLWLCIFYNSFVMYRTRIVISRIMNGIEKGTSSLRKEEYMNFARLNRRLGMYPLILVFCWSFSIVNRLYQYSTGGYSPEWLVIAASSTGALQGFLNALIYGSNKIVRVSWQEDAVRIRTSILSVTHKSSRRSSLAMDVHNTLNPVVEIELPESGNFESYPSEGDIAMHPLYE